MPFALFGICIIIIVGEHRYPFTVKGNMASASKIMVVSVRPTKHLCNLLGVESMAYGIIIDTHLTMSICKRSMLLDT